MSTWQQPLRGLPWPIGPAVLAVLLGGACGTNAPAPKSAQDRYDKLMREKAAFQDPYLAQTAAVITDPAAMHNIRMAAFAGLFTQAGYAFQQVYDRLPRDLEEFIASGFLWCLPWVQPPQKYQYIENLEESNPFWEQLNFVFLPEHMEFSFFLVADQQPLANPQGLHPARSAMVAPGVPVSRLELENQDPLPLNWETLLADPATPPVRRVELLRRRSADPAEVLAIHLFDTLDILADRFTHTQGRLPANFTDLLTDNFVTTGTFRSMLSEVPQEGAAAAQITLHFVPERKAFIKELTILSRPGLVIQERAALQLDPEQAIAGPRRSPLLVWVDPATFDGLELNRFMILTVPAGLVTLEDAPASLADQADAPPA